MMETVVKGIQHHESDEMDVQPSVLESIFAKVFGCWHLNMSRPFTVDNESYRVCLNCGAHRQFDVKSWEMHGRYYYQAPLTASAN